MKRKFQSRAQDSIYEYQPSVAGLMPNRTTFGLSHTLTFSADMGWLYPTLAREIVPGDTWKVQAQMRVQFAPTIVPVYWRYDIFNYLFFVPFRTVWDEWEDFYTGGKDGLANPVLPTTLAPLSDDRGNRKPGDFYDFMYGARIDAPNDDVPRISVSALYARAYYKIVNEWFRDQDLVDENEYPLTSGPDDTAYALQRSSWEKNYFTTARPWAQKGPTVYLPLGTEAPVWGRKGVPAQFTTDTDSGKTSTFTYKNANNQFVGPADGVFEQGEYVAFATEQFPDPSQSSLYVDLTEALSATINQWRFAFQTQKFFERTARGGSRYQEFIQSHFGVYGDDARLQRAEYLGGGRSVIDVNSLYQTSSTDDQTPQANPAGILGGATISNIVSKSFVEPGCLICISRVIPKWGHTQGIDRQFLKNNRLEFGFPEFVNLGERSIFNAEIYAQGDNVIDPLTNEQIDRQGFGFQAINDEYRYIPNRVAGEFRTTLDFWQHSVKYSTLPRLNKAFVECAPDKRIFAVQDQNVDSLWCDLKFVIEATRPFPIIGEPGLIDHH